MQLNVALMFTAPADLSTLPGVSNLSFLQVRAPPPLPTHLLDLADPLRDFLGQILLFRIGKSGALLLWVPVCLVAFFTVHVALHANSRSVYAFSRDRAFPDKGLMGKLNGTTKTPLWAVWSLIVGSLGLGALIFLSKEAANAVFSMVESLPSLPFPAPPPPSPSDCCWELTVARADILSVFAVRCRFRSELRDPRCSETVVRQCASPFLESDAVHFASIAYHSALGFFQHPEVNFRPGPFSLGERTSLVVNIVMVIWTLFACVILCIVRSLSLFSPPIRKLTRGCCG